MNQEDDEQQRIQRALNEAKKRELEEKYGAHFGSGKTSASPEIESRWLNYIEEFERQFEHAQRTTVHAYVGFPTFKQLDQIPPDLLEVELNSVLDFLELHNVVVDFLCEVPDEDAYRFVTTELMNQEMDDVRIEGMMSHFCYEDFHPNAEYDSKSCAENFLWDLFERHEEYAVRDFAEDEVYDSLGQRIARQKVAELIRSFYNRYAVFTGHSFNPVDCVVDGEYAIVTLHGEWSGLLAGSMESMSHKGVTKLRMKKSPYGGFDVIQANILGWD